MSLDQRMLKTLDLSLQLTLLQKMSKIHWSWNALLAYDLN